MRKWKSPEALLALILVFSAVVRGLFFRQLAATDLVTIPLLDCLAYHEWAVQLVSGNPGWGEAYWMGPLYPHFLALVYAIFGIGTMAISGLQLGLSLLNIWLVYFLTHRFTCENPSPRSVWAAPVAAGLYALYAPPVFYAGMILMATLVTTLFLLIAHFALRAQKTNSVAAWIILGLIIGFTGLARGNVFLLLLFFPFLVFRINTGSDRWKKSAAMILAGLLMLAPTTVRNLLVADDFVFLTSNGGINLLIGQQVANQGIFAPMMGEGQVDYDASMEKTLELEMGKDLKGSEVSRILAQRAWHEFTDNLMSMPKLYLLKTYRFWNGYELPQIFSFHYWHGQIPALKILVMPFFLLVALGLCGIGFLKPIPKLIMVILLAGYFLSLLPFFPTSRYRMPVAPLLAISAGLFLISWWELNRQRRWKWLAVATLISLALLPRWASLNSSETNWQVHLHEASRASKRSDLKTTLRKARQAEESNPDIAETPYRLAVFLESMEAWPEAEAALQLAASRAPENSRIPYRMGIILDAQGKLSPALSAFGKAANLDPQWALPWLGAGLTLQKAGQINDAIDALQKAHVLSPGNHRIRSNLASAQATIGQYDAAQRLLTELVNDFPDYINGWFNLALVQWRSGHQETARKTLLEAEKIRTLSEEQIDQMDSLKRMMAP